MYCGGRPRPASRTKAKLDTTSEYDRCRLLETEVIERHFRDPLASYITTMVYAGSGECLNTVTKRPQLRYGLPHLSIHLKKSSSMHTPWLSLSLYAGLAAAQTFKGTVQWCPEPALRGNCTFQGFQWNACDQIPRNSYNGSFTIIVRVFMLTSMSLIVSQNIGRDISQCRFFQETNCTQPFGPFLSNLANFSVLSGRAGAPLRSYQCAEPQ